MSYMNTSSTNNPCMVSIFTGAGGLDIGLERAGFKTVSTLEIHPVYSETIRVNQRKEIPIDGSDRFHFEGASIITDDISNTVAEDLTCGTNEIDCLVGGPPCQAFSSAGRQDSIFDKRGKLVYEYVRMLKTMRPKTFLFENVRGLVTARGRNGQPGEVLSELLGLIGEAGYSCRVSLLNSADYGSYQRRVRCFIVGSRIAAAPYFPSPGFVKPNKDGSLPDPSLKKWRTLGDFLKTHADNNMENWVRPTQQLAEALEGIPDGKGLRSAGRVEATRPGGHWGYRQGTFIADQSLPARTVTGSSSQDWIRLADGSLRRLTLKEVSALQGFPNSWEFCGSRANQFQQVGNAVPTVFGEQIGCVLVKYLNGEYIDYDSSNATILPESIVENIRYTRRDSERNGAYRANRSMPTRKDS